MKQLTITPQASSGDLCRALAAAAALLMSRAFASVRNRLKAASRWATTEHNFFAEDGDPIRCTGARLVAYSLSVFALICLLCIHF